jgi:hypothetical protein
MNKRGLNDFKEKRISCYQHPSCLSLFLGVCSNRKDVRRMGGLWKVVPMDKLSKPQGSIHARWLQQAASKNGQE